MTNRKIMKNPRDCLTNRRHQQYQNLHLKTYSSLTEEAEMLLQTDHLTQYAENLMQSFNDPLVKPSRKQNQNNTRFITTAV